MRKRTLFRAIIIAEVIACYMSLLVLLRYARAPERYIADIESPICRTEDFTSFAGTPGETGDSLPVQNAAQGEAAGWQSEIDISGLDRIHVSFDVDCPEECAGGTLYIDLYNFEADYDSPEQEYQFSLAAGENSAEFTLLPGEVKPETAYIRFFTLDPASYRIDRLNICGEEQLPKVSAALYAGAAACFALLILSAVVEKICNWRVRKK